VRIVVDSHNKNLAHILTEEQLNRRAQRVPRHSAQELIRHTRAEITALVTSAEQLAEVQLPDMIATAQQQAAELQQIELQRLTALAKVNTTIRSDEIEYLRDHAELLQQHLATAQLKLDALRVAITTE
jgi:ATP-dependent helicase HepA